MFGINIDRHEAVGIVSALVFISLVVSVAMGWLT